MIKIRVTFIDDTKGNEEFRNTEEVLKNNYNVLNISKVYKGRNNSKYSNVYFDVEMRE